MEPYAMIQVSVLLPVKKQMGRNVASMFHFYLLTEPLAATRGSLFGKHCHNHYTSGSQTVIRKGLRSGT